MTEIRDDKKIRPSHYCNRMVMYAGLRFTLSPNFAHFILYHYTQPLITIFVVPTSVSKCDINWICLSHLPVLGFRPWLISRCSRAIGQQRSELRPYKMVVSKRVRDRRVGSWESRQILNVLRGCQISWRHLYIGCDFIFFGVFHRMMVCCGRK